MEHRIEVLLSFQRALWDMVTPGLRGVAVTPAFPVIRARFLYAALDDDEDQIVAEVETYVVADFVPPVDVQFEAVAVPTHKTRDLLPGEEWVYLRQEDSGATQKPQVR
jgi:hypothetical protein